MAIIFSARNLAAIMPLANHLGAKVILKQCEDALGDLKTAEAIRILDKSGITDLTVCQTV